MRRPSITPQSGIRSSRVIPLNRPPCRVAAEQAQPPRGGTHVKDDSLYLLGLAAAAGSLAPPLKASQSSRGTVTALDRNADITDLYAFWVGPDAPER